MNTLTQVLDRFFPDSNYKIIATILVLALIVMAALLLFRKTRPQRANLVLGIVIIALGLMVLASSAENRWKWIIGLLPTLMVGYQLFFLWLYHPKETGGGVEVR